MSPIRIAFALAAVTAVLAAGTAPADETSDKQKKAAVDGLKRAEISKGNVVETDTVIMVGMLPEARLKTIGESLNKVAKLSRKALQFDEKDEPWKGKLTVVYLPERAYFTQYMRLVAGAKPESNWHINIRSDEPTIVSGAELDAKATDAEIAAELGPLVAGAWLQAKVGPSARVPGWVRLGAGKVIAYRAEGTSGKRFTTYKSQARSAVLGGGGKVGAPIADIWTSDRADGVLLATSLMDYLTFGPGNANLGKFLSALRPDDNDRDPDIAKVIEDAGWKTPADLEAAWKKWVTAGGPVK